VANVEITRQLLKPLYYSLLSTDSVLAYRSLVEEHMVDWRCCVK